MFRLSICQNSRCKFEHSHCHTCHKNVCESGEADVHRSIGHEVQIGLDVRSVDRDWDVAIFRNYTGTQAHPIRSEWPRSRKILRSLWFEAEKTVPRHDEQT
jgi:hypothetical protein